MTTGNYCGERYTIARLIFSPCTSTEDRSIARENITDRALRFATQAHAGQVRKYTAEPYINHPVAVAGIVRDAEFDDEVIAAALLHDVVEDCDVLISDIFGLFGSRVAQFVGDVTDVSRPEDGNRTTRKALDRAHLSEASPEGKSIKLADLIDNAGSIVERDPSFAVVYMREKALLLPFLTEGHDGLWQRANKLVLDYEAKVRARKP